MGMEKNYSSIAMGDSPKPLNLLEILKEALKIPTKNLKLMVSLILLNLLSLSLLFLTYYFTTTPLFMDLASKLVLFQNRDPKSPRYFEQLAAIKKEIREFTLIQVITLILDLVVNWFWTMAMVFASAMTYSGQHLTLKEVFSRIKTTWKGPVVTFLYVGVLSVGYTLLLFALIGVFVLISRDSMVLIALGAFLVVLVLLLYIYLRAVWSLAQVISVIEEDFSGMAALGKAGMLIQGRKRQGFAIAVLLLVFASAISVPYGFVVVYFPQRGVVQLAFGLLLQSVSVLLSIFFLAVYTVFYYECKKSHGEEMAVKGSMFYTRLPITTSVDA